MASSLASPWSLGLKIYYSGCSTAPPKMLIQFRRTRICSLIKRQILPVLVGYVEASSGGILLSWFPPPDLLNEYMGSTWEWTAAYEEWFCMRMKTIETMSLDARPLSRSEWTHTLKAHAWRIVPPRSCFPPADNSFDDLKERFRSVCGGYHGEHYAGRKLSLFRTATIVSGPASFNIAW